MHNFPSFMHTSNSKKESCFLNIFSNNTKADTSANCFQLMIVQKCIFSSKNKPFSAFYGDYIILHPFVDLKQTKTKDCAFT